MLIEIQCSNLGEFDPATGRSMVCGQRMMVDSAQIGQLVACPKCKQQVEVRASKYDPPQQPSQPGPRTQAGSAAAKPKGKRRPSGNADAPVKTDIMNVAFSEQNLQASPIAGQAQLCRKCGTPAPYGRCPACKYVEPKYAKMHLPLDKIKLQLTGMQLWFCHTLREGMSVQTLAIVSHIAMGSLVMVMMLLMGLLFMNGNTISACILLGMLFVLSYFYGVAVYKGYQFTRNPKTRLAWFQRLFWNFMLMLARMGKWENYDSRLKDRRVIKVKDRGFTDGEISMLDGIRNVQVLDLENTEVTDQGVALLYRLEHLQCVVLRRTNVSHDAVLRLQQTFPRLWIWH